MTSYENNNSRFGKVCLVYRYIRVVKKGEAPHLIRIGDETDPPNFRDLLKAAGISQELKDEKANGKTHWDLAVKVAQMHR